jgi:hypothetical protein
MPKPIKISFEELEPLVKESISYSDVARKLNVSISWACRKIAKLGINVTHFDPYKNRKHPPGLDLLGLKFGRWTVLEKRHTDLERRNIYWKCICDCGNEGMVCGSFLKSGASKSCGCLRAEKASENIKAFHPQQIKYSPQEATARRAFKNYRLNDREIDVDISFELFYEMSQRNCYYCNCPPSNITNSENISEWSKTNGVFIYNGLDRIISSKGYVSDNILTCCKYCNKSKCEMTIDEFASYLDRMLKNRELIFRGSFLNVKTPIIEDLLVSTSCIKVKRIWSARYKDEDLSLESFYHLSQMNCVYCGATSSQTVVDKNGLPFTYNGLDRIDTSKGHFKDNVVPCCYDCNKSKNDRSLTDFDNWLTAINNHWLSKPFTGSKY